LTLKSAFFQERLTVAVFSRAAVLLHGGGQGTIHIIDCLKELLCYPYDYCLVMSIASY
jgi:hypothetical protein